MIVLFAGMTEESGESKRERKGDDRALVALEVRLAMDEQNSTLVSASITPSIVSFSADLGDAEAGNIYRHSFPLTLILIIIYGIIFTVGLIGNTLVVFVVLRSPRFRSSVTYLFILNLAMADLLVILFCLPPTLVSNIFVPWVLGKGMCKLVPYVQCVSVCASVYSLVAVSLDRFIAIWYPLGRGLTKRRARMIIFLIWGAAGCLATPLAIAFDLEFSYEEVPDWAFCTEQWPPSVDGNLYFLLGNLFLCYLFPLTGISLCYVLIWFRVLRRHVPTEDSASANLTKIHQKAKIGVLKMLIVVVFVFLLSWLPLYLIFARVKLGSAFSNAEIELLEILAPIAQISGSFNSSINPILYAFLNVKFRRAFRALLPCGSRSQIQGNMIYVSNGTKSSIIQRQQSLPHSVPPATSGI